MDTKISILFYGRKSKTTRDNLLPIYLRVTIGGKRLEISTHRNVSPGKWSAEAGKGKGSSEEARSINAHLDTLKGKVYAYHRELLQEAAPVTMESFKGKRIAGCLFLRAIVLWTLGAHREGSN